MTEKRRRGRPEKPGRDRALSVRLPESLHKALRHLAVDNDKSLNDVVVWALEEWWSSRPERAAYSKLPKPTA
jgi:predicted HicB family RNase H-like nuclease